MVLDVVVLQPMNNIQTENSTTNNVIGDNQQFDSENFHTV